MDIHFAEPQWVHLLWVVLAYVILLAWLERRGSGALERFIAGPLWSRLLTQPSHGQRLARISLLALAGLFLTLALMRPQWGLELVESRRAGAEIMICLDVSRSMLAEDVAPNRLGRAKAEIRDLLQFLGDDQVGLIAFAGRATVLSPLTPDFGYLRLILDQTGPHNVSRGGTRLEEPIRKAIRGFGDAGAVSRAILLITDGEDHDSFPLEAAKDAAERGIRILAVGFGDESGSEIPITDATTGARTLLTDADGAVVRSRLDGDLLRDMALATDGVYVPAGTGALDLESIYQNHIAPLTRGELDQQARAVRYDAFQWAVMLALLALLGAVLSTARPRVDTRSIRRQLPALLLLGLGMATSTWPVVNLAQQPGGDESAPETNGSEEQANAGLDIPEDPRRAYNLGLAKFNAGDFEIAGRLLESARERSFADGEARFRATYNLGWVEVSAADQLINSEPKQALEHLNRAAEWFREAVVLRPEDEDARYNLELVMRRALELADSLTANDETDLRESLQQLISEQRAFLTALRPGVNAQQTQVDTHVSAQLRRQFRGLASQQLTILSSAEQLSERASRELATIRALPSDQSSAEDRLRAGKLQAVIDHLHTSRERIGQTRSRLRRLQGERAYRRAAAALGALQQAWDQLLDPVTRLDALLADGLELAQLTAIRASDGRSLLTADARQAAPDWLTSNFLQESQSRVASRTQTLHRELTLGIQDASGQPEAADRTGQPDQANKAARLMKQLRKATPLIAEAGEHFETASTNLSIGEINEALASQSRALESLTGARELLLDLRRLIDLIYADERRVGTLMSEATIVDGNGPNAEQTQIGGTPARDQTLGLAARIHEHNDKRTGRLGEMLSDAMIETLQPGELGTSATAKAPTDGKPTSERRRLEKAYELQQQARESMTAASDGFARIGAPYAAQAEAQAALAATQSSVDAAVSTLETLQRLFFNVLEHLQDTARRQQLLADETESVAVLEGAGTSSVPIQKTGPLEERQSNLAKTADAITETLKTQANTPPPESKDGQPTVQGPDPERLSQAADLVASASSAMSQAANHLGEELPTLGEARTAQDNALSTLNEAIALLQDNQNQQQDGEQQQQANGGDNSDATEQRRAEENPGETDLSRLLQGVRDREAQRRQQRAQGLTRQEYEPVEKDW